MGSLGGGDTLDSHDNSDWFDRRFRIARSTGGRRFGGFLSF